MRALPLLLAAALAPMIVGAAPAPVDTSGAMTHAKFARYVATFNAGNLDFVQFYSPDVVFDKGTKGGRLVGRAAIRDWYAAFWKDIDEEIVPLSMALDERRGIMLVELSTRLRARHDNITRFPRPLAKGDRFIVDGTIVYTLKDGLIHSIRGGSDRRAIERVDGAVEALSGD